MDKKVRSSIILIGVMTVITLASIRLRADTGTCGGQSVTVPFTDVMSSPFFCQIAEAFFSGLANGTSATTYSPSNPVTRDQMAAFITRTHDSALRRGSRRASLDQNWTTTPRYADSLGGLGTTTVGTEPVAVKSDRTDLWVANLGGTISRVRASDGKLLDTWTGAGEPTAVLVAMGRVFVTSRTTSGGKLYMIDPTGTGGPVTEVATGLGLGPLGIAFDGSRIWTDDGNSSVSIVTPGPSTPWAVTTVTGFNGPQGILFDGFHIWVADFKDNTLLELNQVGGIVRTVNVGGAPELPAFDGTNIWVPNFKDNSVSVVRAETGTVIATLTANGLNSPFQAAFDGQRILITDLNGEGVSLWKATDLTPIGTFSTGTGTSPLGACSDGVDFWIALRGTNQLARF
jgi:YVTN family beta-propeller protein